MNTSSVLIHHILDNCNVNYIENWKEILGIMLMMTDDFIMMSEAIL